MEHQVSCSGFAHLEVEGGTACETKYLRDNLFMLP